MGLVGFTRTLAQEGAKYGINVNAIAPLAKTRMTIELLGEFADKLAPKLSAQWCALCHNESCNITGEVFSAAGDVSPDIL